MTPNPSLEGTLTGVRPLNSALDDLKHDVLTF